LTTTLTNVKKG